MIRMRNGRPELFRIDRNIQARHSFSRTQVRNILRNIDMLLNNNSFTSTIEANQDSSRSFRRDVIEAGVPNRVLETQVTDNSISNRQFRPGDRETSISNRIPGTRLSHRRTTSGGIPTRQQELTLQQGVERIRPETNLRNGQTMRTNGRHTPVIRKLPATEKRTQSETSNIRTGIITRRRQNVPGTNPPRNIVIRRTPIRNSMDRTDKHNISRSVDSLQRTLEQEMALLADLKQKEQLLKSNTKNNLAHNTNSDVSLLQLAIEKEKSKLAELKRQEGLLNSSINDKTKHSLTGNAKLMADIVFLQSLISDFKTEPSTNLHHVVSTEITQPTGNLQHVHNDHVSASNSHDNLNYFNGQPSHIISNLNNQDSKLLSLFSSNPLLASGFMGNTKNLFSARGHPLLGHRLPSEFVQEMMFGDTTDPPDPTAPPTTAPTTTLPTFTQSTTLAMNKDQQKVSIVEQLHLTNALPIIQENNVTKNPAIVEQHLKINTTGGLKGFLSNIQNQTTGYKIIIQLPGSNKTIPIELPQIINSVTNHYTDKNGVLETDIKVLQQTIQNQNVTQPLIVDASDVSGKVVLPSITTPVVQEAVKVNTMAGVIKKHIPQQDWKIDSNGNKIFGQRSSISALTLLSGFNPNVNSQFGTVTHGNGQQKITRSDSKLTDSTAQTSQYIISKVPINKGQDQNAQMIQNRLQRIERLMNKLMLTTTTVRPPITTPISTIEPDELEAEEMPLSPPSTQIPHDSNQRHSPKKYFHHNNHHSTLPRNSFHSNTNNMHTIHSQNHLGHAQSNSPSNLGESQKHQCNPHLPNFGCEGIGMFKTVRSINAWCVGKCVHHQCVESVCQCGCYINSKSTTRVHEIGNEIASAISGTTNQSTVTNNALSELYNSLNKDASFKGFAVSLVQTPTSIKTTTSSPPNDVKSLLVSIEKMIESKLSHQNLGRKGQTDSINKYPLTPKYWEGRQNIDNNNGPTTWGPPRSNRWQHATTPISWSFQGRKHWQNNPNLSNSNGHEA